MTPEKSDLIVNWCVAVLLVVTLMIAALTDEEEHSELPTPASRHAGTGKR